MSLPNCKRTILRNYGRKLPRRRLLSAAVASVLACTAQANPTGPVVSHGQAEFARPDANTLNVTNSPGAIINWQGFSIGAQEATRFIQQSAASAVLNRVVGQDPSQILGRLSSNGRVFLINPNGIVFGDSARVDTAGLIASSLNMTDADFIAGQLRFAGEGGAVVNRGFVRVGRGGEVMLIAPSVENSGLIEAEGGRILLAAGRSMTVTSIDLEGVSFEVQAPADRAVNLGELLARGGAVGVFAGSIVHGGVIDTARVQQTDDGSVWLVGQGETVVNGVIVARGEDAASGGRIEITGADVALRGALVDASGEAGGGTVLVGGGAHGGGELARANTTVIDAASVVRADATGTGAGGQVVAWSEGTTTVDGRLSARGGPGGGDGGFVETSGRKSLEFSRAADVSAPAGRGGTWLLDPEDIDIDAGKAAAIEAALNTGSNVAVETHAEGAGAGNITVSAPISKTAGGDAGLSLTAHAGIDVNQPIESSAGKLDVDLTAGTTIRVNASISTNGGGVSTRIAAPDAPAEAGPGTSGGSATGTGTADAGGTTTDPAAATAPADPVAPSDPVTTATAADPPAPTDPTASDPVAAPSSGSGATTVPADPASTTVAVDPAPAGTDPGVAASDPGASAPGGNGLGILILGAIVTRGGGITADAGANGGTTVAGTLDASTTAAGATGGNIAVLGDTVTLTGTAVLDASGPAGGGEILIGGDEQGQGETRKAKQTTVEDGATVTADATDNGNGGKVIVYSDGRTAVHGHLSARGGANGGNGGFVETSGKEELVLTSAPDTGAAAGSGGHWLIDPTNETVDGARWALIHTAFTTGTDTVTVQTSAAGAGDGDITVTAPYDYDGIGTGKTLEFIAHDDIIVNGSIHDATWWTTADALSLVFTADSDGSGAGSVIFDATPAGGVPVEVSTGGTNIARSTLTVNAVSMLLQGGDEVGEQVRVATNYGMMDINLSGGLTVAGGSAGSTDATLHAGSPGPSGSYGDGQFIDAQFVEVIANAAGATIRNIGEGGQHITTTGTNVGGDAVLVDALDTGGYSVASIESVVWAETIYPTGQPQMINAVGGGNIRALAASGQQAFILGGDLVAGQVVDVAGVAGAVQVGGAAADGSSYIESYGLQSISAPSVTVQAGDAGGSARIAAMDFFGNPPIPAGWTQTVTSTGNTIQVLGGGGTADITTRGNQRIESGGDLVVDAQAGSEATVLAGGDQTVIAANEIRVQGGNRISGSATAMINAREFGTEGPGANAQVISAPTIRILGGSNGSYNQAEISSNGTQDVMADVIELLGGPSGQYNWASLESFALLQTINAANSLTVRGGSGGDHNGAWLYSASSQEITVGAGGILVQAGAGDPPTLINGVNNTAWIFADDYAIYPTAGYQHITVTGGGDLVIQGGTGIEGQDFARVGAGYATDADVVVTTVGGGDVILRGGTGAVVNGNNYAALTSTGTMTLDVSGDLLLEGGPDVNGYNSYAKITADGTSATINVAGNVTVSGGAGSLNYAKIDPINLTVNVGDNANPGTLTFNQGSGSGAEAALVTTGGTGVVNLGYGTCAPAGACALSTNGGVIYAATLNTTVFVTPPPPPPPPPGPPGPFLPPPSGGGGGGAPPPVGDAGPTLPDFPVFPERPPLPEPPAGPTPDVLSLLAQAALEVDGLPRHVPWVYPFGEGPGLMCGAASDKEDEKEEAAKK